MFNKILAVILVISIIALVVICGVVKKGGASATPANADATSTEDVATIDEFVAGTYGGKEFKTVEDVVNYYVECYNYTKTLGANYTYEGSPQQCISLLAQRILKLRIFLLKASPSA